MASKYLASLSSQSYSELTEKLLKIQNKKCFICDDAISPEIHKTIILSPLQIKGKIPKITLQLRTKVATNQNKMRILK